MTREETITILGICKASYPNFYKDMTKKEMVGIVDLWCEMFESDDVNIVKLAVKELIQTLQFPPTIADIKQKLYAITSNEKDATELWNELQNAIKDGIYHSKEVFERLSPEVKKFVRNPSQLKELAQMDSDVVHSVTKGQFFKQIENIQAREKEQKQMLPETKRFREMALNIGKDVSGLLEE